MRALYIITIIKKGITVINFLKNLFCLNEERISIVIIAFVMFVIGALYLLFTKHEIPNELTDIIIWLAGFIIGYNGLQATRNFNVNK